MKNFFILIISLGFLFSASLFSQDAIEEAKSDTTGKYDEWDLDFWAPDSYKDLNRPTIEVNFNQSTPFYNKDVFSQDLATTDGITLKIGFADIGESIPGSGYLKYDFGGLKIANSFSDLANTDSDGNLNSDIWTFGTYHNKGYGYLISGDLSILLTHATGMNWNTLQFTDPEGIIDSSEINRINIFGDAVRFGESFETAVKIRLIDNIGVYGAYSENLIYSRHLFWHWSLSKIIEGVGQGFASYFINSVKKSSPALVPVAYFLLKNGISFAFHRLREKNMNWPINTAPPLIQRNYSVGLSLIF